MLNKRKYKLRETLRASLYPSNSKVLAPSNTRFCEKVPSTTFLIRSQNINILYSGFFASQRRERGWLSIVHTRYGEAARGWTNIENDF